MTDPSLAQKIQVPVTTLKSWFQRNSFSRDKVLQLTRVLGINRDNIDDLLRMASFNVAKPRRSSRSWIKWRKIIDEVEVILVNWVSPNSLSEWRANAIIGWSHTWKSQVIRSDKNLLVFEIDPAQDLITQIAKKISDTILLPLNIRTIPVLLSELIRHSWTFSWYWFDGVERLEGGTREDVFRIIQWVRAISQELTIAYTILAYQTPHSHTEAYIRSMSVPILIEPYKYHELVRQVEIALRKGWEQTEQTEQISTLALHIQEYWSHRYLTHKFLETFINNGDKSLVERIRESHIETKRALRILLSGQYRFCLTVLGLVNTESATINGERIIKFESGELDWNIIAPLLWTNLFRFEWWTIYTTPLIHELILEVATEPDKS